MKAVVVVDFATLLIPATAQWWTLLAIAASSLFAALQSPGIGLGAKIQPIAAAAIALIVVGFRRALAVVEPAMSRHATSTSIAKPGAPPTERKHWV